MVSRASADNFGVTGMVAAPVPSTAPIISSPGVNATVNGTSALIIGSCPIVTPQVVVSVSVDGAVAGTSSCDSRNDFSVPISVSSGTHQIVASSITVTGQNGPASSPVTITGSAAAVNPAVSINADQPFLYAGAKDITWTGTIGAGTQATDYVHVDWGDNSQSNYAVQPGAQQFSHHYGGLAPHNILIAVSTKAGDASSEQFASAPFATYSPAALVNSTSNDSSLNTPTVMGLYGVYVTVLAVTGIVWLEAKHAARHLRQHALA